MADISHTMGAGLTLGPTGDLAQVSGPALTQQRVLRRLITNQGDYVWHMGYGAGIGRMVGRPANPLAVSAVITKQMQIEPAVASNPPPTCSVSRAPGGFVIADITYFDLTTQSTQSFQLTASGI